MKKDKKARLEYLKKKRLEVLEEIKPICETFNIEYDYVILPNGDEELLLNNIKICCSCNSVSAVKEEVIGYIFVEHYNRWWYHKPQTIAHIKQYWKE